MAKIIQGKQQAFIVFEWDKTGMEIHVVGDPEPDNPEKPIDVKKFPALWTANYIMRMIAESITLKKKLELVPGIFEGDTVLYTDSNGNTRKGKAHHITQNGKLMIRGFGITASCDPAKVRKVDA